MKRTSLIVILGIACLVGAYFYKRSTEDPPVPKIQMATEKDKARLAHVTGAG